MQSARTVLVKLEVDGKPYTSTHTQTDGHVKNIAPVTSGPVA